MMLVALRPGRHQFSGIHHHQARLTGHVASTKGIGAGGALGGGGGGSELLSLDEDFVDEAFVDHGSETGRAEEEQRKGGWQAHLGGRMEGTVGSFGSLGAWQTEGSRYV